MSYKCYICGKEYETPKEAANCTISCANKAEESERKAKLKEIRNKIDIGYKELKDLCKQYSDISTDESVDVSLNSYVKLNYNNYYGGINKAITDAINTEYKTVSNNSNNTSTKDIHRSQYCQMNDEQGSFDDILKSSIDGFLNLWS